MAKPKKEPPQSVKWAKLEGDKDLLSRLGKYGNMVRREIAALDRELKKEKMLAGAAKMAEQANENICPVD